TTPTGHLQGGRPWKGVSNTRACASAQICAQEKPREDFGEKMADREGFEPSIEFPLYTRSRRAPSTTRPPVRPLAADGQSGADRFPVSISAGRRDIYRGLRR